MVWTKKKKLGEFLASSPSLCCVRPCRPSTAQKQAESKQESKWHAGVFGVNIVFVHLWVVFTLEAFEQQSDGDIEWEPGWCTLNSLFSA